MRSSILATANARELATTHCMASTSKKIMIKSVFKKNIILVPYYLISMIVEKPMQKMIKLLRMINVN